MSHDKPIQAKKIAAFAIHFLPFDAFLSSDQEDRTKNPQYNIYTNTTKDKIHSSQLTVICIKDIRYHSLDVYSSFLGKWRIHHNFLLKVWVHWLIPSTSQVSTMGVEFQVNSTEGRGPTLSQNPKPIANTPTTLNITIHIWIRYFIKLKYG